MVAEWAGVIHPVPLTPHHLQEVVERGLERELGDGRVEENKLKFDFKV